MNLDNHAKKKLIKLVGERYCKTTDVLTITTDRWVELCGLVFFIVCVYLSVCLCVCAFVVCASVCATVCACAPSDNAAFSVDDSTYHLSSYMIYAGNYVELKDFIISHVMLLFYTLK